MKRYLVLALLCHLVLAIGYLYTTPVFEGPDENGHYDYAALLAQRGKLPLVLGSAASAGGSPWDECALGHHPPLYYAWLGVVLHAFAAADTVQAWRLNPDFGQPTAATRSLHWRHGYDECPPVADEVRMFRWLRGWSVLCGLGTLLLTWQLARQCFPTRPSVAAIATLLLACLPHWSFTHGVLDNGNLATLLCHATLVLLVDCLVRTRWTWPRGVALGLVTGLALMTKMTSALLLPLLLAGGLLALRQGPRRSLLVCGAIALGCLLVLDGWWFARNAQLYGDALATKAHQAAFASNRVPGGMQLEYLTGSFAPRLLGSLVGGFGWISLDVPRLFLLAATLVLLVAAVGWATGRRHLAPHVGAVTLTAFAALLALAQVVHFNWTFIQPQGRYLFPGIGAASVLLAAGIVGGAGRLPWLARSTVTRLLATLPPLAGVAVLKLVFAPAFAIDASSAHAHEAILHAGLATPSREPSLRLLAPPDGAVLQGPPTFRWESPAGALCSVHVFDGSGRVYFGTWESAAVSATAGEFALAGGHWEMMPKGVELLWKVRQLPNRQQGERAATAPQSNVFRLRRE